MAYLSYQQVDLDDQTVKTVSDLTVPANATHAELQAQDEGDINYTMDGETDTPPGASRGMVLQAGADPKTFLIEDIKNIQFCKSAANTKLNIHYFGGRDI